MNLRSVRKKIRSIRNVRKITKAMQMVSAVKMRKAQASELESRPYRDGLNAIINKIAPHVAPEHSQLLSRENDGERNLIIFITANKGLAGAFNVTLFRLLLRTNVDFKKTDFITVGTKGAQFVSRMGGNILADFSEGAAQIQVSAIFEFVLNKYLLENTYRSVSVVYNRFISTLRSETMIEKLLPFTMNAPSDSEEETTNQNEYLIEPSPEAIIDQLLKSYLEDRIRGAIISSEAVEHSMRMMAMKNATDNAQDVIYNLTLVGNKLRQEKITNELLDMITAKESVEAN